MTTTALFLSCPVNVKPTSVSPLIPYRDEPDVDASNEKRSSRRAAQQPVMRRTSSGSQSRLQENTKVKSPRVFMPAVIEKSSVGLAEGETAE